MLPKTYYDFRNNSIHSTLLGGYLNLLSNEKIRIYSALVNESFTELENLDVFATTAFGDLLAWDGEYIYMLRLAETKISVILSGFNHFFTNIKDEEYQKDSFDMERFDTVKQKYGDIESNECYIYEPVPFMGGDMDINTIRIGNRDEYIRFLLGLLK